MIKEFLNCLLCWSVSLSLGLTSFGAHAEVDRKPAEARAQHLPQGGDFYAQEKSPEGSLVYYLTAKHGSGVETDSAGNSMVWAFVPNATGTDGYYRYGSINSSGKIQWNPLKYTGSDYPAMAGDLKPLPANRSLVPTAQKPTTGSGQAEISSPQTSTFAQTTYEPPLPIPSNRALVPVPVPHKDAGHSEMNSPQRVQLDTVMGLTPSEAYEKLDWSRAKTEALGAQLKKVSTGRELVLYHSPNDTTTSGVRTPPPVSESTRNVVGGALAFYVAMGIISFYILERDYPNDPMVLQKYLESLTDPVGWLMLGGFMAASLPFLQHAGGMTTGGGILRGAPMFAAGMLAGAIMSTALVYAFDPDVIQCLNIDHMEATYPYFHRNLPACDKAYDKFSTEPMMLSMIPNLAHVLAASGLYVGAQYLTGLVVATRFGQAVAVAMGPRMGPMAWVGGALMFLGAYRLTSKAWLDVEAATRNLLIADVGVNSNLYGTHISQVEDNLYQGWAQLRKDGWKDRPKATDQCSADQLNTLMASNPEDISAAFFAKCPSSLDFEGTLDRYAERMQQWRGLQFMPTMQSYREWLNKVLRYHTVLFGAKQAYSEFLQMIRYDQLHPNALANDPNSFTPANVLSLETHEREKNPLIGQDLTGSTWISPELSPWPYVKTNRYFDYIVTAMACGPEGEDGRDGLLHSLFHTVSRWTGNASPDQIINASEGFAITFTPPKITTPLANSSATVCDYNSPSPLPGPEDFLTTNKRTPDKFAVYPSLIDQRQPGYHNLYDYIKANVRPAVMANGENNFETWWENVVGPRVTETEELMRKDYETMIKQTYLPALLTNDYYFCGAGQWQNLGFDIYQDKLFTPDPISSIGNAALHAEETQAKNGQLSCGTSNRHRLALGISNSMRDEMRLYTALLIDFYVSTHGGKGTPAGQAAEASILPVAKKMLTEYDSLIVNLRTTELLDRKNMANLDNSWGESYNALVGLVLPKGAPALAVPKNWSYKLFKMILDLQEQANTYNAILQAFQPALPEAAPAPAPADE